MFFFFFLFCTTWIATRVGVLFSIWVWPEPHRKISFLRFHEPAANTFPHAWSTFVLAARATFSTFRIAFIPLFIRAISRSRKFFGTPSTYFMTHPILLTTSATRPLRIALFPCFCSEVFRWQVVLTFRTQFLFFPVRLTFFYTSLARRAARQRASIPNL